MISWGMVAENITVCLSWGSWLKIVSISSKNPMFSISSASSSTTVWMWAGLMVFLRMWSITRPGVPMTICTPSFRERICLTISWPPYTGSTFTPCMYLARRRISSATWIASSLVGQRAMAWSFLFLGSIFSSRGMPKAAVFPVPVWAWPIMSSPSLWMGIAWAWMGDGSSNPISPMARRILLFSSISSNRIIQ